MEGLLDRLLAENARWAEEVRARDPDFFPRIAAVHRPKLLWFGCSDARVTPDRLLGLEMGEVFVHRNVANVVDARDLNAMAALQFAVEALGVNLVVVCGHYGCAGVHHAVAHRGVEPLDLWVDPIRAEARRAAEELAALDEDARLKRLAELNVLASVRRVAESSIVAEAWQAGWPLVVAGVIYDVADGRLRLLAPPVEGAA